MRKLVSLRGWALWALLLLLTLSGCTIVSSWFPDKHKEYLYSSDIAALEIPPDLTSSTIEGASGGRREAWESPAAEEPTPESSGREATPAPDAEMTKEEYNAHKADGQHPEPTLAQSTQDIPLIEIQAPFETSWSEVNKALGRMKLEIVDQNRSDGLYFVHYAKEQKPYEDRGFFGDVSDMFANAGGGTKEYRIKLETRSNVTSVFVQDMEGQPLRDGPGIDLLKELNATLQEITQGGKQDKSAS